MPLFDTERAIAFGFVAQVDFKQGLRNTIDWYQQQLKGFEPRDGTKTCLTTLATPQ